MSRVDKYWRPEIVQAAAISGSLILSWLLRFDFHWNSPMVLLRALPLLLAARFVGLFLFKSLHGYWRYTGSLDLVRVSKATLLGTVIFAILEREVLQVRAFPISVYVIEMAITAASLVAMRMMIVVLLNSGRSRHKRDDLSVRVLIIGAGFAGHMLVRELNRPGTGFQPVGFVDDACDKIGGYVNGIPVLGTVEQLPQLVHHHEIAEVLMATPSATKGQMSRMVEMCAQAKVRFRSVPSLGDMISNAMSVHDLRDVDVDDLLGRDKVELNLEPVIRSLAGKVILVTGAAGSIGSELCRQILQCGPEKLVCIDRDETALFYMGESLAAMSDPLVRRAWILCIGDVADANKMRRVLTEHHVQVVFHAAAYKHVPLVEANIAEAAKNNVFALWNLLDIADEVGCQRFVMISSDKAVNPSSFMGCTKRIGELLIKTRPATNMSSVAVRFGNVLGSQGSVVPTFKAQIASGRQITITDPRMTRFFMTIGEAVSLVLQASVIGSNGHVFVLDMGEPIRIVDLAKTLIRLSGRLEDDVSITYTGVRPGEKLYEELFYADEQMLFTSVQALRRAKGRSMDWLRLRTQLKQLDRILDGSTSSIRNKVTEIVPEYQYGTRSTAHSETLPFLIGVTPSMVFSGESPEPEGFKASPQYLTTN